MSKPRPLEYRLDEWGITYSREKWSSLFEDQHFQAYIYWELYPPFKGERRRESEDFVEFSDAKKWIDKHIGESNE